MKQNFIEQNIALMNRIGSIINKLADIDNPTFTSDIWEDFRATCLDNGLSMTTMLDHGCMTKVDEIPLNNGKGAAYYSGETKLFTRSQFDAMPMEAQRAIRLAYPDMELVNSKFGHRNVYEVDMEALRGYYKDVAERVSEGFTERLQNYASEIYSLMDCKAYWQSRFDAWKKAMKAMEVG